MRQVRSYGSVKAISLNRAEVLRQLHQITQEALVRFPEICEVRLFGSLARNEETGLSDIDLFIVTEREEKNPIERLKPYFAFFSNRLPLAIDLIAVQPHETVNFAEMLCRSILLGKRRPVVDEGLDSK